MVSRSVYHNNPAHVHVGTVLPPNCANTQGGCEASTGAPYDGTYPTIWNNDLYDGSFGITAKIFLDQISPSGSLINTLEVAASSQRGIKSTSDELVTSFSSKSELALTCPLIISCSRSPATSPRSINSTCHIPTLPERSV